MLMKYWVARPTAAAQRKTSPTWLAMNGNSTNSPEARPTPAATTPGPTIRQVEDGGGGSSAALKSGRCPRSAIPRPPLLVSAIKAGVGDWRKQPALLLRHAELDSASMNAVVPALVVRVHGSRIESGMTQGRVVRPASSGSR